MARKLRILVIGAHPDDCDLTAGGVAALYAEAGHEVTFVSATNGDAGHHEMGGAPLARRRKKEAEAAGAAIGINYLVLDNHDGELVPSLENRREFIRVIRECEPDLIMTHRPNDYHPDHRYTSQLVQDASYMVTVPNVVANTPHLKVNPVIVYLQDRFQKPYPFSPDVVVDIGPVIDKKIEMIHCHTSQFYEWLPYNHGYLDQVPQKEEERLAWLTRRLKERFAMPEEYRDIAASLYGAERAAGIQYAEAFEVCEYGSPLTDEHRNVLFPFFS